MLAPLHHQPAHSLRRQHELQGEPECRQWTTGQGLQEPPCETNADSRILYFSNLFLLLLFLLGRNGLRLMER